MKDEIKKIINIGKKYSNLKFDEIKSQITNKDKYYVYHSDEGINECNLDDLVHLLKGNIILEMLERGCLGHVSCTRTWHTYSQLISLDYEEALSVRVWARKLGYRNCYFPHGSASSLQY